MTSRLEYDTAVASPGPVVIEFGASWCGKCEMIAPFIAQLSAEHPHVRFCKVDTEVPELEALSVELKLQALPEYHLWRDGVRVGGAIVGYRKPALREAVEEHLCDSNA